MKTYRWACSCGNEWTGTSCECDWCGYDGVALGSFDPDELALWNALFQVMRDARC